MNEDDASQIYSYLVQAGHIPAEKEDEADLYILVTCSVRGKPENKALSKLGELKIKKDENPDILIGVCGCMAQRLGDKLKKGRPFLNFVIGTEQISRIPQVVASLCEGRKYKSELSLSEKVSDLHIPGRTCKAQVGLKEFIPIMYGCNNFCSYCVVPYTRGRERSRELTDILDEIKFVADRGCKEITLLGQNVNSYGKTLDNPTDFASLLYKACEISGIERIRFTTSHPKDLSDGLIECMASQSKICKHIHLAVQSGDDEILRLMNRKYKIEKIYNLVQKLREAMPDIAITTDLIVGFPGEDEKAFENTLKMVKDIEFDSAFMFSYNPIPNTPAAVMEGQRDMKDKNRSLERLIALQNSITVKKNRQAVGRYERVLCEGFSAKSGCGENQAGDELTGYTEGLKTVNFDGTEDLIGKIVTVKITEGSLYGCRGELVTEKI